MADVSNAEDIMDSRDIIKRIDALDDICAEDSGYDADEIEEAKGELKVLTDLQEEASGSPDWAYGEALIRDSYFRNYCQDLAEEIGAINSNTSWPHTCIDWDHAAYELQMDYFTVDFDGIDYWIRS